MRNVAEIQAPEPAAPGTESFSHAIELSPELIAYHIQLGRQLRSEAFAQMLKSIGNGIARLFDRPARQSEGPTVTVPR